MRKTLDIPVHGDATPLDDLIRLMYERGVAPDEIVDIRFVGWDFKPKAVTLV